MASFSLADNLDSFDPSAFWFSDADPLFFPPPEYLLSSPDTSTSVQSFTVSGSDRETDSSHKRISPPSGPVKGRVSKRKPRPSKKSSTIYITTDASNFQEMVQQATGVNFSSSMLPVMKPRTKRIGGYAASDAALQYCLPTLDTSAFLLDRHYQQAGDGDAQACALPEFDKLGCFPTLDSWKVM